jgi:hypothetical protein
MTDGTNHESVDRNRGAKLRVSLEMRPEIVPELIDRHGLDG